MNNNKNLSDQIDDLFGELSIDEAGNLIENEIVPSKKDLQEEIIDNIKNNNIKIDKEILSELKKGPEGESRVIDYLRESYGLKYTEEVKQELEVVEPEEIETVGPTDVKKGSYTDVKKESYIDGLGDRLSDVLNKTGMRTRVQRKESELNESLEARIDAIQSQLGMLRSSVLESAGNTIVSGIGQGGDGQSPGSGETRLNRLDDVHLPLRSGTTTFGSVSPAGLSGESRYDIEDGSVLVWDSSIEPDGGWVTKPGDEIGGGIDIDDIADLDPIFGKVWSTNSMPTNCPLFWGTKSDYEIDIDRDNPTFDEDNPRGEIVIGGESVSQFKYLVSLDARANEIKLDDGSSTGVYQGNWFVVGAKNLAGDPLPLIIINGASTDTLDTVLNDARQELVHGVYFREGIDALPDEPDPDLNDLIVGHTPGCVETGGMSVMHWGTVEDYNNVVDAGAVDQNIAIYAKQEPDGGDIIFLEGEQGVDPVLIAEKIIAVGGFPNDDGVSIDWTVVFSRAGKPYQIELNRPEESNVPPFAGPFLYSSSAPCIAGGTTLTRVSTREVTLIKADELTTTLSEVSRLYGTLPIDLDDFEVQEDYNELLAEVVLDLHKLKPTMLVAEYSPVDPDDESVPDYDVVGVHDLYVPIAGDLWFNPNDNTLRAVKNVVYRPDASSERPGFTAEWVLVSGDDNDITTRDVTLVNTLKVYEYYQNNIDPDIDLEDFLTNYPLSTQEDYNIFNLDLLKALKENKPTIHVCSNIYEVEDTITVNKKTTVIPWDGKWESESVSVPYIPKQGDLWVNSDTYTIYVAEIANVDDTVDPSNPIFGGIANPDYPYQDTFGNYLYWVEVGSDGDSGNKVYIQTDPPANVYKGDLWIEDTTYYVYVYQGETWVALTGDQSALGKNFRIQISDDIPPVSPEAGDCWYNLKDSELRIYVTGQVESENAWFPVSSGGISINKYERQQDTAFINYQIQDLNARLAALENTEPTTVQDGSSLTYPLPSDQLDSIVDASTTVLDNIINDGFSSSY